MKTLKLIVTLALFATGLNCARAQSWLTNNLVVHYVFNGTATDTSGNGYTGALVNAGYGTNRFGLAGKSLLVSGSNSWFAAAGLPQINSNLTYSAWLKVSGPDRQANIQSFGNLSASPSGTWNFCYDYSGQNFNLWDNKNATWSAGLGSALPINAWTHVVITYNTTNGTETCYCNGTLLGSRSVSLPITAGSGRQLFIGSLDTAGNQGFNGQVDDVRLYNVALTSNQVSQLYIAEAYASPAAQGTAILDYGFLVYVNLTYGGTGYTNVPTVQFIGGGGSGAQAVAVVSNGVVTAINVLNAGYGYTNAPLVVVSPPYVPAPALSIAPATQLVFSGLTVGTNYQFQQLAAAAWTNSIAAFTASSSTWTQTLAGAATAANYRLLRTPIPVQAAATPVVVNGFVVSATITAGGSGYVTNPAVHITGGGGVNATAAAAISAAGVVTNITILNAGTGYTNTTAVTITAPPVTAVTPAVSPMIQLNSATLIPYVNYRLQFIPATGMTWTNWPGGAFSPTGVTSSQFLPVTNSATFFRLSGG